MLRLNAVHLAVCLLPLALAGCGEPADHDDPRIRPPLVRVATVERAEAGSRAFTGVVVARTQSDLGFRVAGKVLERRVETGQSVKRGQLLLRLDPADLALQAQSQQRAVDAARARAKKAANDLARYRGLVASGAISAAEFDQINAAAEAARADLSAAQAQANVAQNATGYAGLLADADGVVVETLAEPGQVVSAGQVVIRLARAGQREARVQLPETLRPAVGSEALAKRYGSESQPVTATLRLLSDAADATTRTFEARYVLNGALANAPLGSTVTLRIGNGQVALGNGTAPAMYGETPLPATGHAVDLCLYVADLDAVIAAAGDRVAVPAVDTPWGERVAYLRDPEGNMLLVIQDED